jgi:hypothetical protein
LRNISQVSSFTDKERERLVVVQLVIILWDNLILMIIKKRLREIKKWLRLLIIININQLKKEKIKLVKKLFVNRIIKIKLIMRKKKSKNISSTNAC